MAHNLCDIRNMARTRMHWLYQEDYRQDAASLLQVSRACSELDALMSVAQAALVGFGAGPMCRPSVTVEHPDDGSGRPFFQVKALRNATQIRLSGAGAFVPNNIDLGTKQAPFMLLTGPNTGGKSTLMRQVRLMLSVPCNCSRPHLCGPSHSTSALWSISAGQLLTNHHLWWLGTGVPGDATCAGWCVAACRRGFAIACGCDFCEDGRQRSHHDGPIYLSCGAVRDCWHARDRHKVCVHVLQDRHCPILYLFMFWHACATIRSSKVALSVQAFAGGAG